MEQKKMRYAPAAEHVLVYLETDTESAHPAASIDKDRIVEYHTSLPLDARSEVDDYARTANPALNGARVFRELAKPTAPVLPGSAEYWDTPGAVDHMIQVAGRALRGANLEEDAASMEREAGSAPHHYDALQVVCRYVIAERMDGPEQEAPGLDPSITAEAVAAGEVQLGAQDTHRLLLRTMAPEYRECLERMSHQSAEGIAEIPEEYPARILMYQYLREQPVAREEALLRFQKPLHALTESYRLLEEGYLPHEYCVGALGMIERENSGRQADGGRAEVAEALRPERDRCLRTLANRYPQELDRIAARDPAPFMELLAHRLLPHSSRSVCLLGLDQPMKRFSERFEDISGDYVSIACVENAVCRIAKGDAFTNRFDTILEYETEPVTQSMGM